MKKGPWQELNILRFYINLIKDIPILSREEEQELLRKAQAGSRKARNRLTNALLKYVIIKAKKYRCRHLTFMDLIAEGNLGVMRAIEAYNFSKGVRLTTYATYWIHQYIFRAIYDKERLVRIPVYMRDIHAKYTKYKGIFPELDDKTLARKIKISSKQLKNMKKCMTTIFSLFEPHKNSAEKNGDAIEEIELFIDEQAPNPKDLLEKKIDCEILLGILGSRDRKIIELRFGFAKKVGLSLKRIGCSLRISQERVRQLERRALGYMKKFYEEDLKKR